MKGRILLNLFYFAGALGLGMALSYRPWTVYQRQVAEERALHKQAIEMERRRAELNWQRDQLSDPLHKEGLIRSKGWIQRNETPLNSN